MGTLTFKAADVRRIVEHSIAQNRNQRGFVEATSVVLVHDEGVYLMSNGKTRDLISGNQESGRSFCAYAKGCDPKVDPDWYDRAHSKVGGDDFAEVLPWADEIKKALDEGATEIIISIGRNQISFSARYPRVSIH